MSDDPFLPSEECAELCGDDVFQNLNPLDDGISNAISSDDTLQQPPRKKLSSPSSLSLPSQNNPNGEHYVSSDDNIGLSEECSDADDSSEFRNDIDPTHEEEDQVDNVIANALQNMSLEEREKIVHDQHGVGDVIDENPVFVQQQMKEMDDWLQRLTKQKRNNNNTQAYRMAEARDRGFVEGVRLSFLRADDFDPKKAAARMLRYFEFKRYLFGDDKLCQQIVYEDLDADDVRALKKGFMQVPPRRDRAGRSLFIYFPSHEEYASMESLGRLFIYLESRDETMHRNGRVMIIYHMGDFRLDDRKVIRQIKMRAMHCLPLKVVALHHCMNDVKYRLVIGFGMRILAKVTRAKCKLHCCTHQECLYALMTYGIPSDLIPVTENGEIKLKNHLLWIKYRIALEQHEANGAKELIEIPTNNDVLLGKGKPTQEHIGNMRLHLLVEDHFPRYEDTNKKGKTEIAREVVQLIKSSSGRFLRMEKGVWVQVPDEIAREKVSHRFVRNRRNAVARELLNRQVIKANNAGVRPKLPESANETAGKKRAKVG